MIGDQKTLGMAEEWRDNGDSGAADEWSRQPGSRKAQTMSSAQHTGGQGDRAQGTRRTRTKGTSSDVVADIPWPPHFET